MKVAAITRYKQGDLWVLLKKLGWSQTELARRSGIGVLMIGRIINMHQRPSKANADAIQKAFGDAGEYIDIMDAWPETFAGFGRSLVVDQVEDIAPHELEKIGGPVDTNLLETTERLALALKTLTQQEQDVIEKRFLQARSLGDVGIEMGLGGERIRQIEAKALRKMRHPARLAMVTGGDFLDDQTQGKMAEDMFHHGAA
jgi:transcriptional regulator with XRE-family HTH domain